MCLYKFYPNSILSMLSLNWMQSSIYFRLALCRIRALVDLVNFPNFIFTTVCIEFKKQCERCLPTRFSAECPVEGCEIWITSWPLCTLVHGVQAWLCMKSNGELLSHNDAWTDPRPVESVQSTDTDQILIVLLPRNYNVQQCSTKKLMYTLKFP